MRSTRTFAAALACSVILACGGGGSPTDPGSPAPPPPVVASVRLVEIMPPNGGTAHYGDTQPGGVSIRVAYAVPPDACPGGSVSASPFLSIDGVENVANITTDQFVTGVGEMYSNPWIPESRDFITQTNFVIRRLDCLRQGSDPRNLDVTPIVPPEAVPHVIHFVKQ